MHAVLLALALSLGQATPNLCPDPSVENVGAPNQFGLPYKQWGGWKFEGVCEFRVGQVARTGEHSAELVGGQGAKIRLYSPKVTVDPGRYRFSCYLRGLDVGEHPWRLSQDFCFADDKYYQGHLKGTFGWTKMEIVKDVPTRKEIYCAIGLWAPGRLWVDDAELVKVGTDVPLTAEPVFGQEEAPLAPPAALDPAQVVACPDCGYRNLPAWGRCYACGAKLEAVAGAAAGPAVKPLCSFEDGKVKPFDNGRVVAEHATDGQFALRVDKNWSSWDGPQDWTGYDFLVVDAFNSADQPQQLYIEVRDKGTTGYWDRVNYITVIPPGASKVLMPTDIYVGEKSRPGRPVDRTGIRRLVFNIDDAKAPVYFDNIRLERDTLADKVQVPGLQAYHFRPGGTPFRGFRAVTPSTVYSAGRGYGLKNARVWRGFDFLQPDPLYQTCLCVEAGGFAVDLPDGQYHVFLNLDSPSGYWGEYQVYRQRSVKANGTLVVDERVDRESFTRKYFRFAESEDRLDENTFDKYQRAYFQEKEFDVEVRGGQLFLEFNGANWANCLSCVVLYPTAQAAGGRAWLDNLRERRRFWFDNYFKRIPPDGTHDRDGAIPAFAPTAAEQAKGYALFARDWMRDVPVNAVPRRAEVTAGLTAEASAGQQEPLVFSVYPLRDLGPAKVSVGDLTGPGGARVPSAAIKLGVVSHRLSRVTMEGTVYTLAPRLIMPKDTADLRAGTTTTYWLTLVTPKAVTAGDYAGQVTLTFADGRRDTLDLRVRLYATPLDELDLPVGPWGCNIDLPWYREDLGDRPREMYRRCLAKMREYGLTTFSGIPSLSVSGWRNGLPQIDFRRADEQMADARAAGFTMTVVNYGSAIGGFDNYFIDNAAMQRGGFKDYVSFLRAVLAEIDAHAKAAGWLPVAWNLGDEPLGDAVGRSAANAKAWREAAPTGMITTGATSSTSPKPDDPHRGLLAGLRMPNLNLHDEAAIQVIRDAGNSWAFYNGGNRWTFGTYLYKCAKEYDCKLRISWHWNASAGDPYYPLDCREDDYAWCVANAAGELIPSVHFDRDIRAGVDDYRYLLTLARRLEAQPNHPAAAAGRKLLADRLASFKLGQRDHDALWPSSEYRTFRRQVAEALAELR